MGCFSSRCRQMNYPDEMLLSPPSKSAKDRGVLGRYLNKSRILNGEVRMLEMAREKKPRGDVRELQQKKQGQIFSCNRSKLSRDHQ